MFSENVSCETLTKSFSDLTADDASSPDTSSYSTQLPRPRSAPIPECKPFTSEEPGPEERYKQFLEFVDRTLGIDTPIASNSSLKTKCFREQSIDGTALPLLSEDHLTGTMNMKLGPALKFRSVLAQKLGNCVLCMHCTHCHAGNHVPLSRGAGRHTPSPGHQSSGQS